MLAVSKSMNKKANNPFCLALYCILVCWVFCSMTVTWCACFTAYQDRLYECFISQIEEQVMEQLKKLYVAQDNPDEYITIERYRVRGGVPCRGSQARTHLGGVISDN